MTTTAGHSFYIGPIGFFYNQVNDTGSGYVYVNCRYRVLLINIFLSITFTIAINRTLTNLPFIKYI
jgi:hypothetical protein